MSQPTSWTQCARGHDVAWVLLDSPGVSDDAMLTRAVAEQRVLVTFDKDFGDLVFARGQDASCGVLLFRLSAPGPAALAAAVLSILESRTDWHGHFSVADDRRIRMVPLPP